MIQQKENYLTYINEVSKLIEATTIPVETTQALAYRITNAELIVPVIGGFSAGKSTLINTFLESNVLPTNLTPETALATELRYSDTNYIEAIKKDNTIDRYEIDQSEMIKSKASDYQYLKFYLNNEKLKAIEPLVLVDMPGFDSPLELHNQAILNYLTKGVYFIVLTSVEDGGLTKSVFREIENIAEFGKGFSFCISKTNLKPIGDVLEIKQQIKEQLEDTLDFEKDVVLLDDNGAKDFHNILDNIDCESLFTSLFIEDLKINYFQIDSCISTKIGTLKVSRDEAEHTIKALQESIKRIETKKQKMILEVRERYSDLSTEGIINTVANELLKNKEYLIPIALHDSDKFQREVNAIIKNKLLYEINSKMQNISSNIINDFRIELKSLSSGFEGFAIDDTWIDKISEGSKHLITSAQTGLESLSKVARGKKGGIYKVIATTLGLTTTILNPILEIAIIFLPEIISFLTGKLQENKQKEILANKFHTEIIPFLKTKLRETLSEVMHEQIENLIISISEQFESQLQQKEQEIATTLEEQSQNIANAEQQILELQNIQVKLQDLTTKSLLAGN